MTPPEPSSAANEGDLGDYLDSLEREEREEERLREQQRLYEQAPKLKLWPKGSYPSDFVKRPAPTPHYPHQDNYTGGKL
jgi:hypothetical protein